MGFFTFSTLRFKTMQLVATDGGSLKNGKPGCRASFAVVFGKDDPRNTSGEITENPSNQSGEMTAITTAIDIITDELESTEGGPKQTYTILTDSDYGMKCFTTWASNWLRNDWKNAKGKPVSHKQLIAPAYKKYIKHQSKIKFKHIRSHRSPPTDKDSQAYQEWVFNDLADKACAQILKMRGGASGSRQ